MSSNTIVEVEIERIFAGFAIEAKKQIPETLEKNKKKVIIIAGPTASGKTAFAISLAKAIGGEIVSADSMQVYKGMDLGTAKATIEERLEVPHHLIDIRNVTDSFNVVDFHFEARHCCEQILSRGNVPIFVGGSGFYIHALLYGPPSGPPSVPEVRSRLEAEIEKLGSKALYERLRLMDPHYAATITSNDKQKIVRALEIIALTGKKVSKHAWKDREIPLNYDFRCWFLFRPREHLYNRIEKRCDKMLAEGFLDEVRALEKMGIRENSSASQAIGYRQALDFFETNQSEEEYKKFVHLFKQVSRNYAKRQFTWFKREPLFRWLDLDLHDREIALETVMKDFEQGGV